MLQLVPAGSEAPQLPLCDGSKGAATANCRLFRSINIAGVLDLQIEIAALLTDQDFTEVDTARHHI